MTDRPILFSAPMVRALLEGRKTQTRRLLKLRGHKRFSDFGPSDTPGYEWHFRRADGCWCDHRQSDLPLPYAIGDRLWVKEEWQVSGLGYGVKLPIPGMGRLHYSATDDGAWKDYWGRWRSSLHMPRWASRLTLTVNDVRVQRLQDISEADAIAESVQIHCGSDGAKVEFEHIWNSINGPEAWDANPWVVALTFEVEQRNIDAGGAA